VVAQLRLLKSKSPLPPFAKGGKSGVARHMTVPPFAEEGLEGKGIAAQYATAPPFAKGGVGGI
jgi:hypothetical protein